MKIGHDIRLQAPISSQYWTECITLRVWGRCNAENPQEKNDVEVTVRLPGTGQPPTMPCHWLRGTALPVAVLWRCAVTVQRPERQQA